MRLPSTLFIVPFALEYYSAHAHPNISQTCSTVSLTDQLSSIDGQLAANATILSAVPVKLNGTYGDPDLLPGLALPELSTGLPELCAVEIRDLFGIVVLLLISIPTVRMELKITYRRRWRDRRIHQLPRHGFWHALWLRDHVNRQRPSKRPLRCCVDLQKPGKADRLGLARHAWVCAACEAVGSHLLR